MLLKTTLLRSSQVDYLGTVISLSQDCGDFVDMKSFSGVLFLLLIMCDTFTASLLMGSQRSQLKSLLEAALEKHLPAGKTRERRQVESAEPGAVMYLPLGGANNIR